MRTAHGSRTIELMKGSVRHCGVDGTDLSVRGIAGLLWITEDGSNNDVVLRPGEWYHARHHGFVLESISERSVACVVDGVVRVDGPDAEPRNGVCREERRWKR